MFCFIDLIPFALFFIIPVKIILSIITFAFLFFGLTLF